MFIIENASFSIHHISRLSCPCMSTCIDSLIISLIPTFAQMHFEKDYKKPSPLDFQTANVMNKGILYSKLFARLNEPPAYVATSNFPVSTRISLRLHFWLFLRRPPSAFLSSCSHAPPLSDRGIKPPISRGRFPVLRIFSSPDSGACCLGLIRIHGNAAENLAASRHGWNPSC